MILFHRLFLFFDIVTSTRRLEAPLRSRLQLAFDSAVAKGLLRAATVELVDAVEGSASFASMSQVGETASSSATVAHSCVNNGDHLLSPTQF